jgi:putative FmdB family regulatory protein
MPTYDYLCENGHRFEFDQRIADDALTQCIECGAPVRRVLHAPSIHYKGSGFYSTDYGSKKRGPNGAGQETKSETSSSSGSGDSSSTSTTSSSDTSKSSSGGDSTSSTAKTPSKD